MVRPLLSAALLLLLPLSPLLSQEREEDPLARATRLAREGKLRRALALLKEIPLQEENRRAALLLEGNLLFRLKRYEESLQVFQKAVQAGAGGPAWEGIALCASALEKPARVLPAAARALRAGRRSLSLLLAAGRAALLLGRPQEGTAWFRRALVLYPQEIHPRVLLARALLESGRPRQAARAAREGVKALGRGQGLRRILAAALLEEGREDEAADQLELLLREGRARPADLAALGDLKLRLGLAGEALALYRRAAGAGGLDPKEQARREALALWRIGDYAAAERRLLSAGPDLPASWWVEVGRLRLARRDGPGALAALEKALRKDPESVEALLWIGRTALETGRLDRAQEAFRLLLSRGARRKEAWLGLARLREKQGDLRGALSALRRARALAPSDPEVLEEILRLERVLESRRPG